MSVPYKASMKVEQRAWFSPGEYKRLYETTQQNIKNAKNSYHREMAEKLHDKILFMANTGLRPDETNALEYRDVDVVNDEDLAESILVLVERGKRGTGYCESMHRAFRPFMRLKDPAEPAPIDRVFPQDHKKQFNRILRVARPQSP